MKKAESRTKPDWANTHVYLRAEQLQYLKKEAKETGRTLQGMIRWIIDEYAKEWPVEEKP